MTDNMRPYRLEVQAYYSDTPFDSELTRPYDLTVVYDYSAVGETQSIGVGGFKSSAIGSAGLGWTRKIPILGFVGLNYGVADVVNKNKTVKPESFVSSKVGFQLTYNFKQFLRMESKTHSYYGLAYLQGGVRSLLPRSYEASSYGRATLINTTADQRLTPIGIAISSVVPAPVITPRMINATSIYGTQFGKTVLIPTPEVRHKGVNQMVGGTPTVWYHTRALGVLGFNDFDTGYPKVFDPTQFIQQSAFNRISVFGDTYARNNLIVSSNAGAINDLSVSQWLVIENKGRGYLLKGFLSQSFGTHSIINKSPSIFFNGIPAPIFPNQAIGYLIRNVEPAGFDHLEIGSPNVVSIPSLKPTGFLATQFGTQWVSNYTRGINANGSDHSANGKPVVWFRYRHANPSSWQSSKFSDTSTVTHGVRELIGSGFIQQGYGNAWLTAGVRLIEPKAIYKDFLSNHYVGRHQDIKPIGFIDTRFGTRIIPDIQAVYPLGFTGVFGLSVAYLNTQHVKTKGYLSAGDSEVFRWGRQIAFNSTQYVTQSYDSGNGLVPPKWSDYQSIENRNKKIGAIGTLMQRFGYSQIDNNARQLSPIGLLATRFNQSMIAYRIRHLPLQGMEAPYMSDWLVAHNSARVIAPKGSVQSIFGNAELVKTRRYFDRIGRIDSLEMGVSFISHRVRVIDIEKRYSIAPPIIRLPTIDLHTRYIDFRGYETAKYGLASLSIHFRIITPRWTHKDNAGEPAIRNVTPELLVKGHDSQEYGVTIVRTEWRLINAQGDNTQLFGATKISDTKQYVSIRGWLSSLNSQKHIATKTGTNPYVTQNIWLNNESDSTQDGFGIPTDNRFFLEQVTKPFLNQNVLYVTGIDSFDAGVTGIHSNNIQVTAGISIDGVSKGASVYVLRQIIDITGSKKIDSEIVVSNPRVSPHTIWAVKEAPVQAKANHPLPSGKRGLHYVGEDIYGSASSRLGKPSIESTIRTIRQYHLSNERMSVFGTLGIVLKRTIVKPNAFRSARFGIPSIPFTLQVIAMRVGISSNNKSAPKVTRPPYIGPQTIKVNGYIAQIFGLTYSDNFIRSVHPKGAESLLMGLSKSNDKPFMWQGLRIGEHVPSSIGAGDTSSYGDTTISLRVREVQAVGFNAFISKYELESFDGRMMVKNKNGYEDIARSIEPKSVNPVGIVSVPNTKLAQRYIRPDGNSNQFRKGGYHA